MPTVGKQLQHAREAAGLSVNAVAEATKLKSDHIRALESGDYTPFPAPIYLRGSLRTYATLLKLDIARLMADFDAEMAERPRDGPPTPFPGQSSGVVDWIMLRLSRLDWRIVLAVVVLALLILGGTLGYQAWQRQKNTDPLRNLGSGLYQSPRDLGGNVLPVPTNSPSPRR